jgi:Domain of unknown function (DUF4062)
MDKKYQVFISSTYIDLIDQRQAVLEAILRMGHLPVGMERFNAADESQWDVIKRHIDNSDYYILIIARRYGSEDPASGLSYTHKEYRYALEQSVPCIAFMLDGGVKNWNNDFIDTGKAKKKLDTFKAEFKNRMVNSWTDSKDLALQVYASLSLLITSKPRVGWVRGDEMVSSPAVTEEITRLSRENNELRSQLATQVTIDPIRKAYNILKELKIEFSFGDIDYTYTYLDFLKLCSEFLLSATQKHILYLHIFQKITGQEMFELNHIRQDRATNDRHFGEFIDKMILLRLVNTSQTNADTSIVLLLNDKGREVLLLIEHPE